jgi:D-alanyl-lipoteichoic acid acyltransferase DltB (MBOAT superfamily)
MLFNTPDFILFFIFILATITIIKNRKFQHIFLLGASYFFFYYTSNYLVSLLIASTILDFYVGRAIFSSNNLQKKKILLSLSLAGNLGLLGFFKYANFSIDQFNSIGQILGFEGNIPALDIILPIGISFYTFQTISYTVDIYRGKLHPCTSLREFALFVAFFPQLVAGPIVRAYQFLPQLREKIEVLESRGNLKQIIIHNKNLKLGITIMAFGFFKKMFFADNIAPLVNDIFDSPIGHESFTIMLGAIAFGIQIYSDFSGYSDIAIGAALILGFKFPLNFNKPYFASSPSDFWRRWHISLSSWLRDYLYIPLGGNRKSKQRTYFNLATVMFLGGLWHGASWNFVIWGMLHGAYLAVHKFLLDRFPIFNNNSFFSSKPGKIISIIITQYLVFLTWIAFRVQEFDSLTYSMQKYVFLDFAFENTLEIISGHKFEVLLIGMFFVMHFISYKKHDLPKKISKYRLPFWLLFLLIIMLAILLFYDGNPEDFIYFQF